MSAEKPLKPSLSAYPSGVGMRVARAALLVQLLRAPSAYAEETKGDDRRLEPSPEDQAAAQVLFEQGRELLKAERFEAACAKFDESLRLHGALGTQLNLADCYEKIGKTASAWILFRDAAVLARRSGREDRVSIAEERAGALEPKLSRLVIEVEGAVAGLEVRRDGQRVGKAQWGSALPVDPGRHEITASAPGKKDYKREVTIGGDAEKKTVRVPRLEDAPVETKPVVDDDTGDGQRIAGWIVGGAGVVAAGVGGVLGLLAKGKNDDSLEHCRPEAPNRCSAEGVSLRDGALGLGTGSTVLFAAGGALVVTGIVLVLTAPSGPEAAAPASGAHARRAIGWAVTPHGLGIGGRW
jgi:serine/threonine-protein kinase